MASELTETMLAAMRSSLRIWMVLTLSGLGTGDSGLSIEAPGLLCHLENPNPESRVPSPESRSICSCTL